MGQRSPRDAGLPPPFPAAEWGERGWEHPPGFDLPCRGAAPRASPPTPALSRAGPRRLLGGCSRSWGQATGLAQGWGPPGCPAPHTRATSHPPPWGRTPSAPSPAAPGWHWGGGTAQPPAPLPSPPFPPQAVTSSSLGAGPRRPQRWPARTPSPQPPACSQPAQPPQHATSVPLPKSCDVCPPRGRGGRAGLAQPRGLHCCWGGGCGTGLCRAGRGRGACAGGTVGASGHVAPWCPPLLAHRERSDSPPLCKALLCFGYFLPPQFAELFSNNSNKCVFFSCWLAPAPRRESRATTTRRGPVRCLMAAGTARWGGVHGSAWDRLPPAHPPPPRQVLHTPVRKALKTLVRKLLIKIVQLFLSRAGELEAALGPRPSR